jgi:hypothetical protein
LRENRQQQNCQCRAADSFQNLSFHVFHLSSFVYFSRNLLFAADGCHNAEQDSENLSRFLNVF